MRPIKSLKSLFLLLFIFHQLTISAQAGKALFIGNSLTYFDDMPQTVKALGMAMGDTLDVTVYAPGGTGFVNHHTDPAVFQRLAQGGWQYIVLQPGSNESPAFSAPLDSTIKWGRILVDSARKYNPCAQIVLYEISYGVAAPTAQANTNYYFAQSRIRENLLLLADTLHAYCVPAGEVMRRIWTNDTNTLIWNSFGDIHPNAYGSYAIACTFAATLFRKPVLFTPVYNGLDTVRCRNHQRIADSIVLTIPAQWKLGQYFPMAKFSRMINNNQVLFQNESQHYNQLLWSFGDGTTSTQTAPVKVYNAAGAYRVVLKAYQDDCYDTYSSTIQITGTGTGIRDLSGQAVARLYPNPAPGYFIVEQEHPGVLHIRLFDLTGRLLSSQKTDAQQIRLSTSGLTPGTYFYELSNNENRSYGRLQVTD